MKRIFLFILISNFFILKEAFAQEIELERIVITPTRTLQSYSSATREVSIITKEEIETKGVNTLVDILKDIASINISDNGSLGALKTIRMRGSTASQVLILLDGRPLNSPRSGDVDLSTLPLENIERIEILYGSASSLYGAGAMGGVINIITKSPPKEKIKTEFTTSFGTYRTYLEQLSFGGRQDKFSYLLTGDYQSSEGHRDHSEYNAKNFSGKFEYEFSSDNKLTLNSGFHKSKLETPGSFTYFDYDDYQEWKKNFLDLKWDFKPTEDFEILTKAYQDYDRLEFIEGPYNAWGAEGKDTHITKMRGLDLQFNREFTDFYQIVFGFNYIKNLNDSTETRKHKYLVRSGYLENQLDLLKNFRLEFGGRLDDYSNFGTEICPSLSFLYKLKENFKFHGLISRSFRAPTFNDLYWPFTGWTEGNPNLRPEKGISGEFGIANKFFEFLETGLTYFRNDYDNLIKWMQDPDFVWRPKNVDSAIINGVEFKNSLNLSKNLILNLDYTYLRAKNDKIDKYLTYQPKHKFNLSLNFIDLYGFNIIFSGQFVDKSFGNEENTTKVKRYYLFGLDISKKIREGIEIFFSIDNLLNKKYQTVLNYPMPGFSLNSKIKFEF